MTTTLGDRLRQIREDRGQTCSQLARSTGFTPGRISRWESDGCEPNLRSFRRLTCALGINSNPRAVWWLLFGGPGMLRR